MTKLTKIGFRTSYNEEEFEPMQQLDTTKEDEEQTDNTAVMLEDYIPGAVYDGQGNIVSQKSFNAKIKKLKAEARNLNYTALAKLILYSGLSISAILLSYGIYKKYLKYNNNIDKVKTEIVNSNRQK